MITSMPILAGKVTLLMKGGKQNEPFSLEKYK